MIELEKLKLKDLIDKYPFIESYLEENNLDISGYENQTFVEYLEHFSSEEIEDNALDLNKQ